MKCVGIAVDLASMKPRMRTTTTDDVLETWGWLMSAPFFDLSGRAPIPHISISMIYNNVLFLLKGTEIPVFSMPLNFSPDIFGLNTRYFWCFSLQKSLKFKLYLTKNGCFSPFTRYFWFINQIFLVYFEEVFTKKIGSRKNTRYFWFNSRYFWSITRYFWFIKTCIRLSSDIFGCIIRYLWFIVCVFATIINLKYLVFVFLYDYSTIYVRFLHQKYRVCNQLYLVFYTNYI